MTSPNAGLWPTSMSSLPVEITKILAQTQAQDDAWPRFPRLRLRQK